MTDRKGPQKLFRILLSLSSILVRSHLAPKAVAISNLLPLLVLGALRGRGGVVVECRLVTLGGRTDQAPWSSQGK